MVHSGRVAAKQILRSGKRGVKRLAEEMHVPLLGQIPIVQSICENGDNGTPEVLNDGSQTGQAFMAFARRVVEETDRRNAGTGTDAYRRGKEVIVYIIMYKPFCRGQDIFLT